MNKDEVKKALEIVGNALDSVPAAPDGNRRIVVLDRGWIFAGNLSQSEQGVYALTNAKNVRKWQTGGFGLLSKGAKSAGATLDDSADLTFDPTALIFAVAISKDWENG